MLGLQHRCFSLCLGKGPLSKHELDSTEQGNEHWKSCLGLAKDFKQQGGQALQAYNEPHQVDAHQSNDVEGSSHSCQVSESTAVRKAKRPRRPPKGLHCLWTNKDAITGKQ